MFAYFFPPFTFGFFKKICISSNHIYSASCWDWKISTQSFSQTWLLLHYYYHWSVTSGVESLLYSEIYQALSGTCTTLVPFVGQCSTRLMMKQGKKKKRLASLAIEKKKKKKQKVVFPVGSREILYFFLPCVFFESK